MQLPVYATPTCAANGTLHVSVNAAGETVMVSAAVPVTGVGELSIAEIENENVAPAVVGVPEIAVEVAVGALKPNPGGSEPTTENV